MAKVKEWVDFDVQKLYSVELTGVPRRMYRVYSPREAVASYERDFSLSSGRDITRYRIHEVRNA